MGYPSTQNISTQNPSTQLKKASIFEVDSSSRAPTGGKEVTCMFNPFEYTVSKSNSFAEPNAANGKNAPAAEFSKAGAQTLKLNLIFDTYGTNQDVRTETDKLWEFMAVKSQPGKSKKSPPAVAFCWGSFYFVSYITQMTQKFTLFDRGGIPVRAVVDVTFTQYIDEKDYKPTNPTSGGGPVDRAWLTVGADRLDNIAADVYGDATKWRLIANYNNITDPTAIRPGQYLVIPAE
jgi:nucleoid-associated protein YgaU